MNRQPEYTCDRCDEPTWNGAGHWLEELGNEERLCRDCYHHALATRKRDTPTRYPEDTPPF